MPIAICQTTSILKGIISKPKDSYSEANNPYSGAKDPSFEANDRSL